MISEIKPMNTQAHEQLSKIDLDKLKNYEEVEFETLEVGNHFPYTTNKYQEEGRKISYGVVKTKEDDHITINGYIPKGEEPTFPDWKIIHPDRNKKYRFYKRIQLNSPETTSSCE